MNSGTVDVSVVDSSVVDSSGVDGSTVGCQYGSVLVV